MVIEPTYRWLSHPTNWPTLIEQRETFACLVEHPTDGHNGRYYGLGDQQPRSREVWPTSRIGRHRLHWRRRCLFACVDSSGAHWRCPGHAGKGSVYCRWHQLPHTNTQRWVR